MRVRVVRTIHVKPGRFHDFLELSLKAAEHAAQRTKIRPDVFWVKHGGESATDVVVHMDFDSLAQYEKLFLEGLLFDQEYLTVAEQGADMVKREPNDGLIVLMDKDDFFMNMKDKTKGAASKPATPARGSIPPQRYRVGRYLSVPSGKLRKAMQHSFEFMDNFERAAKFRPELYCTRFTADSIGSVNMFFDFDNCPMCEPALMQHTRLLQKQDSDLIDTDPVDRLLVRVTPQDLGFDIAAAARP
jgi:hypothetical protein